MLRSYTLRMGIYMPPHNTRLEVAAAAVLFIIGRRGRCSSIVIRYMDVDKLRRLDSSRGESFP